MFEVLLAEATRAISNFEPAMPRAHNRRDRFMSLIKHNHLHSIFLSITIC